MEAGDELIWSNIDMDPAWLCILSRQLLSYTFIAHCSSIWLVAWDFRDVTFWWAPDVGAEALDVECPVSSCNLGICRDIRVQAGVVVVAVVDGDLDVVGWEVKVAGDGADDLVAGEVEFICCLG